MIPIIGIMVGTYITTRMVQIATGPGEKSRLLVALAWLTLAVNLLGMVMLLFSGSSA